MPFAQLMRHLLTDTSPFEFVFGVQGLSYLEVRGYVLTGLQDFKKKRHVQLQPHLRLAGPPSPTYLLVDRQPLESVLLYLYII